MQRTEDLLLCVACGLGDARQVYRERMEVQVGMEAMVVMVVYQVGIRKEFKFKSLNLLKC